MILISALDQQGREKPGWQLLLLLQALESGRVSGLFWFEPIVEAGERLGFLPGDLAQKVHPYFASTL